MSTTSLEAALENDPKLLMIARDGIEYHLFEKIVASSPFKLKEWSRFLHITERTVLRYKKDNKSFEPIQSEKIIQLLKILKKGEEVFGSAASFHTWLGSTVIALGGIMPKEILDSSFGIDMIMNELGRIEHGILA